LTHYNFTRRRHSSLGHKAPAARLAELEHVLKSPEEVPLVNGELPWIATALADLD